MPLTVNQIANNTASVTFPYAGDTATIVYYPAKITEKTIAVGKALANANEATMEQELNKFNDHLASLIRWWDVYDNDEQTVMFPLQGERLAELPLLFRAEVIKAILEDVRPKNTIAP